MSSARRSSRPTQSMKPSRKRSYLVFVPMFERDYDEVGCNAFWVNAKSLDSARDLAERIVGTESWWDRVHGDDLDAREETVYGQPIVLPRGVFADLDVPFLGEADAADGIPSTGERSEAADA